MNENMWNKQTNKKLYRNFFLSAGETLLLLLDIHSKNNKFI